MDTPNKQETFEGLVAKKYEKTYHLVDKPEIAFKFSSMSCKPSTLNKVSKSQSNTLLSFSKNPRNSLLEKPLRQTYTRLKEKLNCLLKDIDQSAQSSFALSEFIEYKQLVIKGFLSYYLSELRAKCREKADFLLEIWNQVFQLVERLVETFIKRENECERDYLQQNIRMQKDYCKALEVYKEKQESLKNHAEKMEKVIEHMAQELRIKKKQAKKIYNDNYNLINTVNDYRQQKNFIEMEYIDLMINTNELSAEESKNVLRRKEELYEEQKEVIQLKKDKKKNMKNIKHEINIEGKTDFGAFMKEINYQMNDEGHQLNTINLDAAIDNVFVTKEREFELNKFELDFIKNKNYFDAFATRGTQTRYIYQRLVDGQTQTRITDRMEISAIKNSYVQTENLTDKAKLKLEAGVQYEKAMQNKCNTHLATIRVINYQYATQGVTETLKFKIESESKDANLLKDPSFMEIKYREKSMSAVKKSKFESKSTQTDFKPLPAEEPEEGEEKISTEKFLEQFRKKKKFQKPKKRISRFSIKGSENHRESVNRSSKKKMSVFGMHNKESRFSKFEMKHISQKRNDSKRMASKEDKKAQKDKEKPELFKSLSRKGENEKEETFIQNMRKEKSNNKKRKEKDKDPEMVEVMDFGVDEIKSLLQELSSSRSISSVESIMENDGHTCTLGVKIGGEKEIPMEEQKLPEHNNDRLSEFRENPNESNSEFEGEKSLFPTLNEEQKQRLLLHAQRQKKKRKPKLNSKRISDVLFKRYIEKTVKIKLIKKKRSTFLDMSNHELVEDKIEPFLRDVKKKIRESVSLTKKPVMPIQIGHVYSILSQAYRKAYEQINRREPLENFAFCLYETLEIQNGKLKKEGIYKKMINFVAQLHCESQDKICESFLFFLNLAENNPFCKKVTTFDCYLYLKLLEKLSINGSPLSNLHEIYTNLQKLMTQLPLILEEENISQSMIKRIVSVITGKFENLEVQEEEKLDIFACCLAVITEIISSKEKINETFQDVLGILDSYNSKGRISLDDTQFLTNLLYDKKVDQIKALRKIEEIARLSTFNRTLSENEFSSYIIRMGILSFEELYKKLLSRFNINSFQKLDLFRENAVNCQYLLDERSYYERMMEHQPRQEDSEHKREILLRLKDIVDMNHVQKHTTVVMENMLGKQMSLFYSFSVIFLNKLQEQM